MANEKTKKTTTNKAKTSKAPTKKTKKPESKGKKIFKNTMKGILVFSLICFVVALGYVFAIIKSVPPLDLNAVLNLSQPSMLYDDKGEFIDNLPTDEERYVITIDKMPQHLLDAFVSIEDERFYKHPGVDIRRLVGSQITNVVRAINGTLSNPQGGSTITQQLIKNTLLTDDVTVERKIKEMYLAIKLEKTISKDKILETYLNTIPLGGTVYGVEAASLYYFGKSAIDLTLPECALLAGMTQAPTTYSPYNPINQEDPTDLTDRVKTVLMKMKELGKIDEAQYNEAYAFVNENKFAYASAEVDYRLNYEWFAYPALEQVKRDLKDILKKSDEEISKLLVNGGLRITTTMDRAMQDKVQAVLDDRSNIPVNDAEVMSDEGYPLLQASATVMDYHTGEVKVLIGGRGEQPANSLNRAYDSLRAVASTTKPLTSYAPAIESKLYTAATPIDDAPLPSSFTNKYGGYNPNNWDYKYSGIITPREAIAYSKNTAAVLTVDALGLNTALSYGEKFGLEYGPDAAASIASIALGEFDGGNTYKLAAAYGTFGNEGNYTEPKLYTKVVDATGKVLLENQTKTEKFVSPETAYIMYDLLKGPAKFDAGSAKFSDIPVAGKTGTSQNVTDFWFAGLTPYYSGSVWIGYDLHDKMDGVSSNAAYLWGKVMGAVHEGLEYKEIEKPSGVTSASVCMDSGKKPTGLCSSDPRGSRVRSEMFIAGTEPTSVCDVHVTAKVNKNNNKLANENTPSYLIVERIFIKKANPNPATPDYNYVLPSLRDDTKEEVKPPVDELQDVAEVTGIYVEMDLFDAVSSLVSNGFSYTLSGDSVTGDIEKGQYIVTDFTKEVKKGGKVKLTIKAIGDTDVDADTDEEDVEVQQSNNFSFRNMFNFIN